MKTTWLRATVIGALTIAAAAAEPITPLINAHAHNDYAHARPLLDALDQGFCSVEADIHLVDGQLLVAHDRIAVKPERTLQRLYLEPLRDRVRANGGRVYRDGPPFSLLIDFKTAAEPTWAVLRPVLDQYADLLTEFSAATTTVKAVTVVLSGMSPREEVSQLDRRLAGIDGRLPDLTANPSSNLVPWVSENWTANFQWRGVGEMPAEELRKLSELVTRAHEQGRRVRFWGTVDTEPMWSVQRAAGVDLINTDRLIELRRYLTRGRPPGKP